MKRNKFNLNENLIICLIFLSIIMTFFLGYYPYLKNGIKDQLALGKSDYISLKSIADNIKDKIDKISIQNVLHKSDFIEINGFVNKTLGKKVVDDIDKGYTVAKLSNGKLAYSNERLDTSDLVQKTIEFNNYLNKQNVPFLYIQAPNKISPIDKELPTGFYNFANENFDELLNGLNQNNISTFDLREKIQEYDLNHYDLFFNTDHHWLPSTALWAADKISLYLNHNYNFSIDESKYDINNYSIKSFENSFLGSMGKRVGQSYGGVDNFEILLPKFDTDFEVSIPSSNETYSGSFEDTMIYYNRIKPDDYYNSDPYSAYLGGNYPIHKIKNNKNPNDKKILLIKDSFSCSMAPYLALSCKELVLVDLRYYKESVKDLIISESPDLVISMYSNLGEQYFNFN